MTALADVTASAQAYGDQRYSDAWALQQGTIDSLSAAHAADTALNAQLNGQIALDDWQIAALQAQIAVLTPAKVIDLTDFGGPQNTGLWTKSGKFVQGVDATKTIYRMPLTSKTTATYGTTPWFAMMFGGGSSAATATDLDVGGFTLDCTQVVITHHGLRFGYSKNGKLHDVVVRGARGTGSSPPAETFAHPSWHSDNETLTNVTLDGRDASGVPVGATGWGGTSCNSGTAVNLRSNYMANGFGIALFNCQGDYLVTDSDLRYNRKAVNIEAAFGGTVHFVRTDFRGLTGAAFCAQVSTAALTASVKVTFEDCLFDNDFCQVLTYSTAANKGINGQRNSDIVRIDKGVVVTDPAKFALTR